MTKQETFNMVTAHLLAQNEKSMEEDGHTCLYRSGPLSCAIGCLIPDHLYRPEMERVGGVAMVENVLRQIAHDTELCWDMQSVHDRYDPSQWRYVLVALAERHNLDATMVDRIAGSVAMARSMTGH